ncbi:hypothetical protein [Agrobacterium tumefaciens]|uniref:hypothetical protein n=1 Tax=Agrobacterium tumefaciens TaxID=358 RepID=UPI000977FB17|nr:hypothetical protein [Agrobacterium tumefaciens]OMP70334.1 hypothetical protein BV900_19450 [Agrobacterium tumefaciens]
MTVETEQRDIDGTILDSLELLKAKKVTLLQEMRTKNASWKRDLEKIENAITALEDVMTTRGSPSSVSGQRKRKGKKNSISSKIRDFAIAELTASDRPLDRSEILEKIVDAGIVIQTRDPAKFLSRVLWRTKELINDGSGYWLASRPRK